MVGTIPTMSQVMVITASRFVTTAIFIFERVNQVFTDKVGWYEAEYRCVGQFGGHLVSIHSEQFDELVHSVAMQEVNTLKYWIGKHPNVQDPTLVMCVSFWILTNFSQDCHETRQVV